MKSRKINDIPKLIPSPISNRLIKRANIEIAFQRMLDRKNGDAKVMKRRMTLRSIGVDITTH